ncbi:hypothetical protein Pla52o_51110 [Novipirellula galeiformis]|uniref:Uncharacterized protein n=1 Tax=Novipirellula galeiformis TaxID=2528004 RepID=A0A5C6C045_9BACT|nr:hypothetical protein Pla52o_51110 [Novipirellula galeiformis]
MGHSKRRRPKHGMKVAATNVLGATPRSIIASVTAEKWSTRFVPSIARLISKSRAGSHRSFLSFPRYTAVGIGFLDFVFRFLNLPFFNLSSIHDAEAGTFESTPFAFSSSCNANRKSNT